MRKRITWVARAAVACAVAGALAFGASEALASVPASRTLTCHRCTSQAQCAACCAPEVGTCMIATGVCLCG